MALNLASFYDKNILEVMNRKEKPTKEAEKIAAELMDPVPFPAPQRFTLDRRDNYSTPTAGMECHLCPGISHTPLA